MFKLYKMGPRGANQYIFGNSLCSENARKLRFHVFLHINAKKHDIIILPEVEQIHKNLFQFSSSPWGPIIETDFSGGIHGI